ncbi:hypothetical protein EON65_06970 [archaeon]|nr:MAG: hypothetical protein EON65_06970 [archaeon]
MTTYARFIHNGQTQTVALFDGLQTDELVGLLKTIFNVNSDIVGIMAEVACQTYCFSINSF